LGAAAKAAPGTVVEKAGHHQNMIGDGVRLILQLQIPGIERLSHQHVPLHKQQVAGGHVDGVGLGGDDPLALTPVERSHVDTLQIGLGALGQIQVVLSIGQKLGPCLRDFSFGQRAERLRFASRGRQAMQQSADWDKDHAVTAPRPPEGNTPRLAEADGRPSGEVHLL
jgi:hypothetical protein